MLYSYALGGVFGGASLSSSSLEVSYSGKLAKFKFGIAFGLFYIPFFLAKTGLI